MSQIYSSNLKDIDRAVVALNTGMSRTSAPASYYRLANAKCYLYISKRRYKEADETFQEVLPKFLEEEPRVISAQLKWLIQYYYQFISGKAGVPNKSVSTFYKIMDKHPYFFDYSVMTNRAIQSLISETGKEKEALAWAKLNWMLCSYKESDVNAATALLQKAWIAAETSPAKGIKFLNAMQDARAENPLKEISLPTLSVEKIKALAEGNSVSSQQKITLNLMLQRPQEAMLTARRLMLNDPVKSANLSTMEMARIFKATDLNLVRANALVQFMQTGEGANPMDDFLEKNPTLQ